MARFCDSPETLGAAVAALRAQPPAAPARRAAALADWVALWEERLAGSWAPPEGVSFPWPQVRRSLGALLPGAAGLPTPPGRSGRVLALVLAGNTPLLAWPALLFGVALGLPMAVKRARGETYWPAEMVQSLALVAPELAARIAFFDFPGDDVRTGALVAAADAVVAYGAEDSIAALRAQTPAATPFLGFGHALSAGLWRGGSAAAAAGFAVDTLLYSQGGCLSPQALFVDDPAARRDALAEALARACDEMGVAPRTDPAVAGRIRAARDLAAFEGCAVLGDPALRWTLVLYPAPRPLPAPVGFGVLPLLPMGDLERLDALLEPAQARLSCLGVASDETAWSLARRLAGPQVRLCRAGEMQTPPLGWKNGGVDLFAWFRAVQGEASSILS